jgi:hypothetical protein
MIEVVLYYDSEFDGHVVEVSFDNKSLFKGVLQSFVKITAFGVSFNVNYFDYINAISQMADEECKKLRQRKVALSN